MKVIYFDIDTLRPDHLSCCGYGRPTPHIDALAADGVRFSRAYASNTPCMPARAALFTGCFGVVNGVETHGTAALSVATPPETALPRVLSWEGVHTAAVSSFGRHPAPWFYNGFSHVIDPSYCCFSKRMRKLFIKNEKSVLRFCNKSSKTKRAFTKVLMPCKRTF